MEVSGFYAFLFMGSLSVSLFFLSPVMDRKKILQIAFFILTIFLSIRYNWGTDYPNYHIDFNSVVLGGVLQHFEFNSVFDIFLQDYDIGWYALFGLFKGTSFYFFIACLTIFEMIVIYISIKKYVQKKWYWLALFIFVFNPSLMLYLVTTMRQFFAQVLFLLAIIVMNKKRILSIVLMIVAVTIHLSALYFIFVIGIVFLVEKYVDVKRFVLLLVLLYLFAPLIPLSLFLPLGNEKIAEYMGGTADSLSIGFGAFLLTLINIILVGYSKELSRRERVIVLLYTTSSFAYPLMGPFVIFQRLVFYHINFSFLAVPIVFQKSNANRMIFLGVMAGLCLFYFVNINGFFSNSIYSEGFATYQTIFSAP